MSKKNKEMSLVEQMEIEMQKMEKDKHREKVNKLGKPSLLKRIWAGLLDIFFVLIISVGVEIALVNLFSEKAGYNTLIDNIHTMYEESGLYYLNENNNYVEYDDYKKMDKIIIDYYTNDQYASSKNMIDKYNNEKQNNKCFVLDNNQYVEKLDAKEEDLKAFYEDEYQDALNFFSSNPDYYSKVNKVESLVVISFVLSLFVGTSIIYLVIPLIRKEGETPSQIIHRICIVDVRDISTIKRWQIIVRYLILFLFNYCMPLMLYLQYDYFVPLTIIISVAMICITKNNIGPHDYASQSMVILKSRVDPFQVLNSINGNKK